MFVATMLMQLFLAIGIVTGAMTLALVIYEKTLSADENDQLYLNKTEQIMMGSGQVRVVGQMQWLSRLIYAFVAFTAVFLLASAALWLWIGLHS